MKKFLIFTFFSFFALVGCTTPDDNTTNQGGDDLPPVLMVSPEEIEVDAAGGAAEFSYSVENPVEEVSVLASVPESVDWVSGFDYSTSGKVKFIVSENPSEEPRETVVTVAYEGAESKSVTIKQAAAEKDPIIGTQYDFDVVAKTLCGNYFGDEYSEPGVYNYNIGLSTDSGREILDIVTGQLLLTEDQPYYQLDLFAAEPSAELNIKFSIPVGTYVFDPKDTCAPGTISAYYTYMTMLNGTTYEYEETSFTAGKLVVTTDLMELTLTDTEGKVHHVVYAGNTIDNNGKFGIWKDEGVFSTLTGDVNIVSNDWDTIVESAGDYYFIGKDYWEVIYYDFNSNTQFYLSVLSPAGAEKLSGEFPVSADLNKPQMTLPGLVSSNNANWSWYEIYDSNDNWVGGAPLVSGKMVISDNSDGTQHVVLDFVDDLNYSIKAELDTDLANAVSPWSTRSSVKISRKHHSQILPRTKTKLIPVKR